ncbi:uncharacterized protein METZ01_LOCUS25841 [marine metagenome]|uniref:Uncharacterized protein n=1 Tax=marine metagenome TaxID=408172 RepID=A0A381Q4F9_9ZZZZ
MIEILNSRSKLIFNQFNVEYWIFIILCLSQICSCKLNWKGFEKNGNHWGCTITLRKVEQN